MSAFSRLTSQLDLDMHAWLEISLLLKAPRRKTTFVAAGRVPRLLCMSLGDVAIPLVSTQKTIAHNAGRNEYYNSSSFRMQALCRAQHCLEDLFNL